MFFSFISTLLTAVLTHHLGWVATVFPSTALDSESLYNLKQPYNALWGQLTDLYGAIGHPIKTAQTVITGNNKNNVITKLMNSLTYFIRFSNVERKNVCRSSIEGENKTADLICIRNNCIPKESYKKYEDHLKELLIPDSPNPCCSTDSNRGYKNRFNFSTSQNPSLDKLLKSGTNVVTMEDLKRQSKEEHTILVKPLKGLSKIKSSAGLTNLVSDTDPKELPSRANPSKIPSSLGDNTFNTNFIKKSSTRDLKSLVHEKNISKSSTRDLQALAQEETCSKLSKGCDENQNNSSESNVKVLAKSYNFSDLSKLEKKTELEKQGSYDASENSGGKKDVVFVLGENEELVGLKKEEGSPLSSSSENKPDIVGSGAKRKVSLAKRPSTLSLSKVSYEFSQTLTEIKMTEPPTDSNCKKCLIHTSSSLESFCLEKSESSVDHSEIPPLPNNIRAQSEPPDKRKITPPKYQYSRVKFNIQQYPQVVKNYLRSKNIELEGLSLGEKVFDKFATVQHNIKLDLSGYDSDSEEVEALQTPSNASELEFSPDMGSDSLGEDSKEAANSNMVSAARSTTKVMKLVNIPMPK